MCFSTHHSNAVNSVDIRFFDIQGQDLKNFLRASGNPELASAVDRHDDKIIQVTFLLTNSEARELGVYGFWDHDEDWDSNTELLIEIARRFPRNVEIEEYQDAYGELEVSISVKPIQGQGEFLKDIYLTNR